MISTNNLLSDFELSRARTLYRRMDDSCFDIFMTYIPLMSETDFINQIENLETNLQIALLSSNEFGNEQQFHINVIRTNEFSFSVQTMQLVFKRVYPINTRNYIDVLPPRLEKKEISLKNIQKLDHQIKAFDFFYPK